jgi:SAM-dependent methyltransferase
MDPVFGIYFILLKYVAPNFPESFQHRGLRMQRIYYPYIVWQQGSLWERKFIVKIEQQMDEIYSTLSAADIPWNMESPPEALKKWVGSGWVKPCRGIDIGCGLGGNTMWFARMGFEMTGIDCSGVAISQARKRMKELGVYCNFVTGNILNGIPELQPPYGFALDWEVLHHILPPDRPAFVRAVAGLLEPGGRYLSCCFSIEDSMGEGSGPYRTTRLGTHLYFSTEDELRLLFTPFFDVFDLSTIDLEGKSASHKCLLSALVRNDRPLSEG